MVLDGARWCSMVFDGARWCSMVFLVLAFVAFVAFDGVRESRMDGCAGISSDGSARRDPGLEGTSPQASPEALLGASPLQFYL